MGDLVRAEELKCGDLVVYCNTHSYKNPMKVLGVYCISVDRDEYPTTYKVELEDGLGYWTWVSSDPNNENVVPLTRYIMKCDMRWKG